MTDPRDDDLGDLGVNAQAARRPILMSFEEFMAERDQQDDASLWGDALLVPGGGYLVLSGDGGVGKTIVLANLAVALALGRPEFLGLKLPGRPVRVAIFQVEGSRARWRKRLHQTAQKIAGCPLGDLPILIPQREANLTIATLGSAIEDAEKRLSGRPELVILDPITRFFEGDDNKSDVWKAQVTKPLDALAKRYSIPVAFSDHYGKPNENRSGQHKTRGSSAKLQDAGAGLRLEIGQGGAARRLLFFDRVRDGALPFSDRPDFDGTSRLGLVIDVAAGTVAVDPQGAAAPVPEMSREQLDAKKLEKESAKHQHTIEAAVRSEKPKKGYPGLTINQLAQLCGVDKRNPAFRAALRGLTAQGVLVGPLDGPSNSECYASKP